MTETHDPRPEEREPESEMTGPHEPTASLEPRPEPESEPEVRSASEPAPASESPTAPGQAAESGGSNAVRGATLVVLLICVALFAWYLIADRLTPRTSQARVQAIVVPVAPQVSGIIASVEVSENQPVEPGQLLFSIDPTDYELALQLAETDLLAAEQAVGVGKATVTAAEAGVEAARVALRGAQLEADRLQRIRAAQPGAISDRRVVMAETSVETAEAQLASAQANLEKAVEDLGQTGPQNVDILRARSAVAQAKVNLKRTEVRSPGAGLVTGVRVDRGNLAAAGGPLMTFVGTLNTWVEADFTENNLGNIKPGDRVDMVFDVHPGRVFSGTVRSIGYGVNVGSDPLGSLPTVENDRAWLRDAQRFPVLIDFEDEELNGDLLKVGSQASVVVYTGSHPLMNWLARLFMRLESWTTFAY